TDKTTRLKFFADDDTPTVEETLSGAPSYTTGEEVFYGNGLKCTISAHDNVAGVEKIYISTNGETFEPYLGERPIDKEKQYHLRFYAVDYVGHYCEPKAVSFTVDLGPPETNLELHNKYSGNVLSSGTTIKLTGTDEVSGLKNIYYQLDDQAKPSLYTGSDITLNHLADGEHILSYYSLDNVQNQEEKRSYGFYLDKIPPAVKSSIETDLYQAGGIDYISPRSGINLSAADNKGGVARIEYAVDQE
ncbi:MAG: hypothetical protein GY771_10600, partial [bacterium]|nr:hypothetical protein [bacterium]